jgi:hypothetical protein
MDSECSKQSKWFVTKELPILDIVACVLAVVAIITSIVVAVGVHSIHFNLAAGNYPGQPSNSTCTCSK